MLTEPRPVLFVVFVSIVLALACEPSLPISTSSYHVDAGAEVVSVTIEPSAPLDAAPPIVRVHVAVSGSPNLEPTSFWLIHGQVSTTELRELASSAPSAALSGRIVPSIRWRDAVTGEVVIAPTEALHAGDAYAVAGLEPPAIEVLSIVANDSTPSLARVWPPLGAAGTVDLGIWCGDGGLPAIAAPIALDPVGPSGTIVRGAVAELGSSCARFEGKGGGDAGTFVPPPTIGAGAALVRLDPRAFQLDVPGQPVPPLPCGTGEVVFGPGCARVADDRIEVRAPNEPLFWAIVGGGLDTVHATDGVAPMLIAPLSPETQIDLTIGVIDARGAAIRTSFSATTLAPAAHVVINEVMAHPLGPEPQEEWIELYNDGSAVADLEGFVLLDPGGETALPHASIAPGAYVLIVNDGFEPDDDFDPPPAPGTLLVHVPKLGKNGLSDEGEPLVLKDGAGAIASRFPASPKPKLGVSVVRIGPLAPDEAATSFVLSNHAASPGGPNDP